jgi:anti-anti-sigma factor
MEIHERRGQDHWELRLSGSVTAGDGAAELERAINRFLLSAAPEMILDLSSVELLDAGGIGALVNSRRRLAAEKRLLTLGSVSPQVRRVLDVAGLAEELGPPRAPAPRLARSA